MPVVAETHQLANVLWRSAAKCGQCFLWVKDGPLLSRALSRSKDPLSDQVADAPPRTRVANVAFQVATARDVALTPPQCPTTEAGQVDANGKPIPYFQKEFFHNGYINVFVEIQQPTKYSYSVISTGSPVPVCA